MNTAKNRKKEKSVLIPINELMPNPLQPRRRFDEEELCALCESIKEYGVIQPVAVKKIQSLPFPMPQAKAKYEIIAGERRWRAAKMAGFTHIPCLVFEADRNQSAMMALVENLQRSDLSFFEEALAMQTLMLMTGQTQLQLAKSLAISQSTLSNKIRLLRLSERERLLCIENGFSERHCRALVRLESEKERRPIILSIIKDKLSAPETEKLIDGLLKKNRCLIVPQEKKQQKSRARIKGSVKDIRVLYNTIEKAVLLLSHAGYAASWEKTEIENALEIRIAVKRL